MISEAKGKEVRDLGERVLRESGSKVGDST